MGGPPPMRGDEREQSVFHLVPFAGARWKVTDGNRQTRFIRELLQLQFPEPQPGAVTAPAIGSDQQRPRQRIQGPAFATPPSSYGCDRECSRVMVRAHVHESGVARQVVDAIRISAGNIGRRKVVPVYFNRLLCGKPLLAAIIVVSEQFLLLGVHRYYRHPRRQGSLHRGVDMTELRIAVGMIRTFLRLPIALQTVVLIAQKLCHFLMTDRMLLSCQLSSQSPGALQIHRRGDSGSPRVSGSIRRSNETSSLGSRSTMFFRPAPDRRTRPGIAFPSAISRIPLTMAFRETPLARRILETPPYPKARASLAAISRRLRSSRSSHTLENFRRRELCRKPWRSARRRRRWRSCVTVCGWHRRCATAAGKRSLRIMSIGPRAIRLTWNGRRRGWCNGQRRSALIPLGYWSGSWPTNRTRRWDIAAAWGSFGWPTSTLIHAWRPRRSWRC